MFGLRYELHKVLDVGLVKASQALSNELFLEYKHAVLYALYIRASIAIVTGHKGNKRISLEVSSSTVNTLCVVIRFP